MAKKNARAYDIEVRIPGSVTIQGDILNNEGGLLTMRCKKANSSSYEQRVFPLENVLTISGGVGKRSVIQVKGEQVIGRFPSADIDSDPSTGKTYPGFTKVVAEDADGKSLEVFVRSTIMNAVAPLTKDEAPGERLKHDKSMKPSDPIVTKRPKREITEKQKEAAVKNLKKADAKNKDRKAKKNRE